MRLGLVALALAVLGVAGCGGDDGERPASTATARALPAGTVATIDGGKDVTAADWRARRRLVSYQATLQLLGATTYAEGDLRLLPVPGTAEACVAALRRRLPKAPDDAETERELTASCEQAGRGFDARVVNQLLSVRVNAAEAERLGVRVSDAAVRRGLSFTYGRFGGRKRLAAFTRATGITDAALRDGLRETLLAQRLRQHVVRAAGPVREADLRRYYRDNPTRFTRGGERDVRVLVLRTEAAALAAKQEVEAGASLADLARQRSADVRSRSRGGLYRRASRGQLPSGLRAPAFDATQGKLTGPVEAAGGYALFRVEKIAPTVPLSFAEAEPQLRQVVPTYKPLRVWEDFQQDALRRWRGRITCTERYVLSDLCGNRPSRPDAGRTVGS